MALPASLIPATARIPMQTSALPPFPNGSVHAGRYTLIFRIRIKRTLELLHEHRLILMPQRFSQTTEVRSALYYTKGSLVADTPAEGGIGATYFQIVGHTGFAGVQGDGTSPLADRLTLLATPAALVQTVQTLVTQVTTGQPVPLRTSRIDGAAAIKDLQETLALYFWPNDPQTGVTQTQDLQLEFLNLTAPTSAEDQAGSVGFVIHPHRNLVDLQQEASKPFLYQYSLQFAALRALDVDLPDLTMDTMSDPQTGLRQTVQQFTAAVRRVTNGVNTIADAMTQIVVQNVTGPVSTFLLGCTDLGDALGAFMNGTADKIRFPLYAQRLAAQVLDAPRHSVTTLAEASRHLGAFLVEAADPRSLGRTLAGETLTGGSNDALTVSLNGEPPQTVHLGTQSSGAAIASAIQSQVQALPPAHSANAAAYRDFTASYDATTRQYTLASGTKLSDAGQVTVVVTTDPALTPGDASGTLGLGLANGGQEHAGSAYPTPALALLRGVEEACVHLQAFPEYFADQLEQQDAVLAALLPAGVTRPQIRGDQRMQQTRVTPGDSLQGIAARVGVDWQTLALVNRLTYPYILEQPTTLTRGRVSSASLWTLDDTLQAWPVDAYQGQVVQILMGIGAGQSRRILRNTATQLVLDMAWEVVPEDISTYAIQSATNPIVRTGMVTSATGRTVTNGTLSLVPESQRGLTLVLTSGPAAGQRRPIVTNDATTYTLETPWDIVPPAGSLYALLGPGPATLRQKLVGDWLSVPQPSAQTPLPIRTRPQEGSAITGPHLTQEEKLFGRDALLDPDTRSLVYDPALGDVVTIAGLDNLRMALVHYINLPLGELEYRPSLGSFVMEEIGLTATLPLQIQLLSSVQRTIKQDPRIAAMRGAQLVTQGGQAVIAFGATAVNGAAVERVVVR